jgi:uncharacterized membrane protein
MRRATSLTRMNRRLVLPMIVVVLVVWLVGAAVTKYSLEQMALYTPVAMLVLGATAALVLLWVKIVLEALRGRRGS